MDIFEEGHDSVCHRVCFYFLFLCLDFVILYNMYVLLKMCKLRHLLGGPGVKTTCSQAEGAS